MRRLGATLALAASLACKSPPPQETTTTTTPTEAASPTILDAAKMDSSTVAALSVPCRIIAVTGDARADDAGLRGMQPAPLDFMTLAADSSLTAKDGKTAREVTLKGPGRARVCVEGREEVWLASGELASVPGAGEGPGAQVWVMTPRGTVRYGAGHAHVTVTATSTVVRGQVDVAVYPAVGAKLQAEGGAPSPDADGWVHVAGDASLALTGAIDEKVALVACSDVATRSRDLAHDMLRGDAGALGDAASKHVVERRRARALCGVALLVARTASPFSQADVDAALDADHRWHDVPR